MPIPTSQPSSRTVLTFALAATLAGIGHAQCTYTWPASTFAGGSNEAVTALAVLGNGDVVAGGRFTSIGGNASNRIARWNGSAWSALGSGMNADVYATLVLPSGEIAAAGSFTTAGGVTTNCVARWNGTAWSGFGNGIDALQPFGSNVQALAVLQNGDIVAAGSFGAASGVPAANIARWNGTSWSGLGAGLNGPVRGLAVAPNGSLYAIGSFAQTIAPGQVANSIAMWNGTSWSVLGTGLGIFGGDALAILPNGDVVVGGTFVTAGGAAANRIARWNGSSWSALGSGMNSAVTSLRVLANGDLIAGGLFTSAGGVPANRIARWNGTSWSAFGTGADGTVHELAQGNDGDLVVGGEFLNTGGASNSRLALVRSSCAPVAVTLGTGCSGSGGFNTLAVTNWPLIGSTFRASSSGMPAFGFVLAVTGFTSTALPIALALPQGLPGCTLYANLDLIDVLLPNAGSATSALGLGNNPALVGASFFHQHVPLELDLLGNITAISSTNALQLTVGTF